MIYHTIHDIFIESSTAAWFATPLGASHLENGTWNNYTINQGLIDTQVRSIAVDNDGAVWFATPSGVSKFQFSTWTHYIKKGPYRKNKNNGIIFLERR